jgi:hypothetical protein
LFLVYREQQIVVENVPTMSPPSPPVVINLRDKRQPHVHSRLSEANGAIFNRRVIRDKMDLRQR